MQCKVGISQTRYIIKLVNQTVLEELLTYNSCAHHSALMAYSVRNIPSQRRITISFLINVYYQSFCVRYLHADTAMQTLRGQPPEGQMRREVESTHSRESFKQLVCVGLVYIITPVLS